MNSENTLTVLFRHNLWANMKLLAACVDLINEPSDVTVTGTYGSISATMQHLVTAETSYLGRISTGQPVRRPKDAPPLTAAEMKESLQSSGSGLIEWANKVQPQDSVEVNWDSKPLDIPKTILLTQAINHATEHRAQIMVVMTQLGIQPPDLDGWTFFEELNL
jgi:uncharacterized damage-inducible protein DinB